MWYLEIFEPRGPFWPIFASLFGLCWFNWKAKTLLGGRTWIKCDDGGVPRAVKAACWLYTPGVAPSSFPLFQNCAQKKLSLTLYYSHPGFPKVPPASPEGPHNIYRWQECFVRTRTKNATPKVCGKGCNRPQVDDGSASTPRGSLQPKNTSGPAKNIS